MGIAKELVDRQHQLLRQRNVAAVPELYTPDAVFLMPGLRVHPHELPALMQAYLAAFPDADNQVTGWIEAPEGIAVEQTITGTHNGTWVTPFWGAGCDRQAGPLGVGRDRPGPGREDRLMAQLLRPARGAHSARGCSWPAHPIDRPAGHTSTRHRRGACPSLPVRGPAGSCRSQHRRLPGPWLAGPVRPTGGRPAAGELTGPPNEPT